MTFRKISDSEISYTELMIPSYANFGGKVHGGILLSIMDKVAYVCASKHSDSYVVTVAVEGVAFLSPVEVGDLLTVNARVVFTGNSTMIVGMDVECYHTQTKTKRHTNSCFFTMAAKDPTGGLMQVPGLIITNKEELLQFNEGRQVRDMSKRKREVFEENTGHINLQEIIDTCSKEKCSILFQP